MEAYVKSWISVILSILGHGKYIFQKQDVPQRLGP